MIFLLSNPKKVEPSRQDTPPWYLTRGFIKVKHAPSIADTDKLDFSSQVWLAEAFLV